MRKLFYLIFLSIGVLSFSACNKDDNNVGPQQKPDAIPTEAYKAFVAEYPNATNVEWRMRMNYYIASFDNAVQGRAVIIKQQNDAWYSKTGKKEMLKEDIEIKDLQTLYPAIYATCQEWVKRHVGFKIDDADKIVRNGKVVIKVEMENKTTNKEWKLIFNESGILLREGEDLDHDDTLPFPEELLKIYTDIYGAKAVFVEFEIDNEGKIDEKYELEIHLPVGLPILKDFTFSLEKEIEFIKKDGKFIEKDAELEIDEDDLADVLNKFASDEKTQALIKSIFGLTKNAPWSEDDIEMLDLKCKESSDSKVVTISGKYMQKALVLNLNKTTPANYVYEIDLKSINL